jgi:hypothetical protein
MAEQIINQEYLQSIFEYKDGNLFWKLPRPRIQVGNKAGTLQNNGYFSTKVNGKLYLNHRLIFLYHYGYLPKFIDHINNNSLDNRLENLRECTLSQNQQNQQLRRNNTSGVKGVCWHKKSKKWIVHIHVNGKNKHFGLYENIELAITAAKTMRNQHHKEFANHGL